MRKHILLAATAGMVLAIGLSGSAQALVPVMDQAVINLTTTIAADTKEQVTRLNDIKATTDQILQTLGKNGQAQYDLNKNQSWKDFSGGGAFLKTLTQFAPNTCAITKCSGTGAGGAGSTTFTDLKSARNFVMQNLYSQAVVSQAAQRDYAQARQNAEREANVSGFSLALVARQYLVDSATRAQKLDGIVNGSSDLRGDLRANSAVVLAEHQQINGMMAILTSMLERDATSFLAQNEKDYTSAEGGTTPPDVYNDNDHLVDGTRVGVNNSSPVDGTVSQGGGGTTGVGTGGAGSGSTILAAGTSSSNAGVAQAFQSASGTYGNNSPALALGAGAAAATTDGNAAMATALNSAASSVNSGSNLTTSLMGSATQLAGASGNDQLKYIFDSGSYGMTNNDFTSQVSVGGQNTSMVSAMLSAASSLASSNGNYKAAQMVSQAQSALSSGTIDPKQAAITAMIAGAQSTNNANLTSLAYGVQSASYGSTPQSVITSLLYSSGQTGSTVANVAGVLTNATW